MAVEDFYGWFGQVAFASGPVLQAGAGLDVYVVAMLAGMPGKPDGVPDQAAVLFWDDQQAHADGPKHYGVRLYQTIHKGVYGSAAVDWAQRFTGELAAGQPAFLVDQPADWMAGPVTAVVGSRPQDVAPADFRAGIAQDLDGVEGARGAAVCADDDYLVYFVLGDGAPGAAALAERCDWKHVVEAKQVDLSAVTVGDEWPGLTIGPGDCINPRYVRRWEG
jgi:hypothetical protein